MEAEVELTAVQQLLDRLEASCAPPSRDPRFYGWEPLPLLDFYRGMDIVGRGGGRSFLDVGSGIGSKLSLAAALGFAAAGVERVAAYAATSRELFPECAVTVADAFDHDAFDADVVYCYRPCIEPADQDRLNRRIAGRMKRGALFFSAGGPYPDWLEPVGFQVWRR